MARFDEDDTVTVEGTFLHETDKAVLIEMDDGEQHWIPFSCCDFEEGSLDEGEHATIEVQTWFAEKQGLA